MTGVLIGVGNEFRRDDGVGPAVARALENVVPPGWRIVESSGDPTELLELWSSASTAMTVDSVVCEPSNPGRVHRFDHGAVPLPVRVTSSHGLGVAEALRLAEVLGRVPQRHIVYAIEIADTGVGEGLSPVVAAAVPVVVAAARAEMAKTPCHRRYPQERRRAMLAKTGDWLITEQPVLGKEPRMGLIVEVHSSDGSPPYLVKWTDNDHTALVFPGPDSIVRTAAEVEAANQANAERAAKVESELSHRSEG